MDNNGTPLGAINPETLSRLDRRGFAIAMLVPAVASLTACGSDPKAPAKRESPMDSAVLKAALDPRYRFYEKCFDAKKVDEFVDQFYTDDIVAISEGAGYTSGKPAMRELVTSLMKDMKRIRVTWHEPYLLGPDVAFDLVQNEVLPEGGATKIDQYKSFLVWRRIDGVWRVAADMYTTGVYAA